MIPRELFDARQFTIWVCPECGFYDADPILRRGPDSRHGVMRCFCCANRACKYLDLSRTSPSAKATRRQEARESAPVMVATRVAPVSQFEAVKNERDLAVLTLAAHTPADTPLPTLNHSQAGVESTPADTQTPANKATPTEGDAE